MFGNTIKGLHAINALRPTRDRIRHTVRQDVACILDLMEGAAHWHIHIHEWQYSSTMMTPARDYVWTAMEEHADKIQADDRE